MLLCFNVCDPPHPFFHPRESILPGRNVTIVEKEGRIPPSSCVPSADPRQLVSIIRGKRAKWPLVPKALLGVLDVDARENGRR